MLDAIYQFTDFETFQGADVDSSVLISHRAKCRALNASKQRSKSRAQTKGKPSQHPSKKASEQATPRMASRKEMESPTKSQPTSFLNSDLAAPAQQPPARLGKQSKQTIPNDSKTKGYFNNRSTKEAAQT